MEYAQHAGLANGVARGVVRLFLRHDLVSLCEVPLGNGRRADVMALSPSGIITIVEIKVARGDLLGDTKWRDYLDYCDRYFWAVPAGFETAVFERDQLLPATTGLITADRYDGAIIRDAATSPLMPVRRKHEILRFARTAARRSSRPLEAGHDDPH